MSSADARAWCEARYAQEPATPAPAEDAPPAVGDLVEAERVPPGSVVERAGGVSARLPDGRGLHGWPLACGGFEWPGVLLGGARLRLLAVGLTEDECKAAVAGSARAALYPAEVPPCASRT